MKKLTVCLLISLALVSCNKGEGDGGIPDPTLAIEFGHFVYSECCAATELFSDQKAIRLQYLDSSIIVAIREDFLTDPEIIGGHAKINDEFTYTFIVETSDGDREIFVSNENVLFAGGSSGDNQRNGIWYSEMVNEFVVPINYADHGEIDNNKVELNPSRNTTITVHYQSQFSGEAAPASIEILNR